MKRSGSRPLRTDLLWGLIAALFLASAPHLARVAPTIALFFVVMMLLRVLALLRPRFAPGRLLLLAATLGGFGTVFVHYPVFFGKRAGVALLVAMVGLKLLESRTERDLYVGVLLGYFLLITLFLFHQSIGLAIYALLIATGLTALLVEASRAGPAPTPLPALRRGAGLVLQALPLMVALFFFFPRLPSPLWNLGVESQGASTGVSDTLSPGSFSSLVRSESIAFRADFDGPIPPPPQRYWRGPVFWQTDGVTWRDDRALAQPFRPPERQALIASYRVVLEPTGQPWLFTLDIPLDEPRDALLTGDYRIISDAAPKGRVAYRARSALEYNTGPLHPFDRRYALQLPGNVTDRMRALVAGWRKEAPGDLELVDRALDHFRREAFYYTLSPPALEENPADQFLFESRRGFCEHYAASFTLLMRIAGVPARVVGGYQGGEVNPLGNYLVVRQSDAHAWSEVWIEGRGWVRVDPTAAVAPERVERSFTVDPDRFGEAVGTPVDFDIDPDLVARLRQGLAWGMDALETTWNRWILGYSDETQARLLQLLGLDFLQGRRLAFGMVALTGLVVALLALGLWLRSRPKTDPVQAAYRRFCRRMAGAGLARRSSEGPVDYAGRIAVRRPDLAEPVAIITRLYVDLRYAAKASPPDVRRYRELVRRFRP